MSRANLFHPVFTRLQTTWDATTLSDFMACPERYRLAHLEGWTPKGSKVDLEFGRMAGEGLEQFWLAVVGGATHDEALKAALRHVLALSWDKEVGKPRLGSYIDVWRCEGTATFWNEKGNKAKCPYSHKGKLFLAPAPPVCGRCGSAVVTENAWFPHNKAKDRMQLVRLLVWYTEEIKNGKLRPVTLEMEDGKHFPLLESHWQVPFMELNGIKFWLCGNLDTVKHVVDPSAPEDAPAEVFITDYKTTKSALSGFYFSRFNPNVQVNIYDLVGEMILPDGVPYSGVAIEAFQCLNDGVRFGFHTIKANAEQKVELVQELRMWLVMAQQFAQMGYWPKNRASCALCAFKRVCGAPPSSRDMLLRENFEQSFWNPTTRQREPASGLRPAALGRIEDGAATPHVIVAQPNGGTTDAQANPNSGRDLRDPAADGSTGTPASPAGVQPC